MNNVSRDVIEVTVDPGEDVGSSSCSVETMLTEDEINIYENSRVELGGDLNTAVPHEVECTNRKKKSSLLKEMMMELLTLELRRVNSPKPQRHESLASSETNRP